MGKIKDIANQNLISWVDKKPWLSLFLYSCIYGIIGWSVASRSEFLMRNVRDLIDNWNILIADDLLLIFIRIFSLILIVAISLMVMNPFSLITFIFEESVSSDLKSFVSVLVWSVLLVFVFCNFDYFTDFLVVASATILVTLDLEERKIYGKKLICIMVLIASIMFSLGAFTFDYLH
ncbi:hypothetical protein IQ215_12075 [Cyanobacterium stanieri LEGE 03274]|uniref:Uncharacterized protein n=1 Tax=Cyanobacterium stanieri LEGE 03274 TaxID=1828756 RepID=A0ABR9V7D5_9CHRO|nr:hypothetical protein [Cyanobacterium stanieri]MBE9223434.1 hypothetical protein [Cyanobacterium stanieri LEGE 03274]